MRNLAHGILPDLSGVQCDGCRFVATGPNLNLVILTCGINFNPKSKDDRRLCRDCAKDANW